MSRCNREHLDKFDETCDRVQFKCIRGQQPSQNLNGRCLVTDSTPSGTRANQQVQMPDTDSLNGLLAYPPTLLEFTFDQLRTLVVVREAGSANGAARILGREQSSV